MTQIVILPHPKLCPEGKTIDVAAGENLCDALLQCGIEIEHACEKSCACTTCHIIIRKGFNSLALPQEREEDLIDKAWGAEVHSRLSCQVLVPESEELVIEIPRYTINQMQ